MFAEQLKADDAQLTC